MTPNITLTATLEDLSGVDAGTTADPARLQIVLCGYGLTLPRIIGTSMIAKVKPEILDTGAPISVQLWGNDQIDPANTYYMITVFDGQGNVVQSGMYRFTGTATIDLSNAVQIVPTNALAYSPCAGVVPGTTYTAPGPIIVLYYNGAALDPGIDFSTTNGGATALLNFTTEADDEISALCAVVDAGTPIPAVWLLQWSACTGAVPGTAYVAPAKVAAVAINGVLQSITAYTVTGNVNITLTVPTVLGDKVAALCSL